MDGGIGIGVTGILIIVGVLAGLFVLAILFSKRR